MGNTTCVPQPAGRFRYSFSRKPSLKKEQDSKKKLASLFGIESGHERDITADKILQYIPGRNITDQENQKENLDQRFPSLFKKGRRKTVVRNLGKIIYYSKVKFKFQHCQEVNDCYLELFQSHLYFQSVGSNGLTYQGLLPLKELSVCDTEKAKRAEPEQHAFRITGPLLNPLIVYCPSESELKRWLYHLEKQIQLSGGNLDGSLPYQSDWKQNSFRKEELRWSVQNMPVQEWRGTQRESLGDVLCVSKVKLQHLPFQEQHDRLLILYPSTLVIISEERNGLYFKGELPLNAIQVHFEEKQKSSFLIEGRLINSIRVTCPSYEDYQEWLYCLKTAQFRNADSSISGSESLSGSKPPHLVQCWPSTGVAKPELRRSGSARKSKGKCGPPQQLQPSSQDSERAAFSFPESPHGELLSPVYNDPYSALSSQRHPLHLDLNNLNRWSLGESQTPTAASNLEKPAPPCSPLYADPYTPTPTAGLRVADADFLEEFVKRHGQTGSERQLNGYAEIPGARPPPPQNYCQPVPSSRRREPPAAQRCVIPGTSSCFPLAPPADVPYPSHVPSLKEECLGSSLQSADGSPGVYHLPGNGRVRHDSAYHDYTELHSCHSDFSYDNLWDAEGNEPGIQQAGPSSCQQIYHV
ncbi:pleckstrin homology domain-containing family N member 1 isoform X2 [Pelodiscus sinensis]|uniref:pleckstrin homology domain-containing family N member 1 isoform X2 n=1 Tax=Pelodiscus sinensis TaxID=13735 RepID=UPI003F6C630B